MAACGGEGYELEKLNCDAKQRDQNIFFMTIKYVERIFAQKQQSVPHQFCWDGMLGETVAKTFSSEQENTWNGFSLKSKNPLRTIFAGMGRKAKLSREKTILVQNKKIRGMSSDGLLKP